MAYLYLEEYGAVDGLTGLARPALTTQRVAIGAVSAQSAAFNTATIFIIATADIPCQIAFGANPTAVATSGYLPAAFPRPYTVVGGQKVANIQQQA